MDRFGSDYEMKRGIYQW